MLGWLCGAFLTVDALIQIAAICTCLEGKVETLHSHTGYNQAHFNVNAHPGVALR